MGIDPQNDVELSLNSRSVRYGDPQGLPKQRQIARVMEGIPEDVRLRPRARLVATLGWVGLGLSALALFVQAPIGGVPLGQVLGPALLLSLTFVAVLAVARAGVLRDQN